MVSPLVLAWNTIPGNANNPVLDLAHIIDEETENELNRYLKELEQKSGAQFAVLTIESREAVESIRSSLNKWKLAQKAKANGVVFWFVPREREWKIIVSHRFERALPDSLVNRMARELLLRYTDGVYPTTLAIANKIAEDTGVKIEGMPQMKYYTLSEEERITYRMMLIAFMFIGITLLVIICTIGLKNDADKRKREEDLKRDQESKRYQHSERHQYHKSEDFQRKDEEKRRQENRRKSEEERRRAEEQNRRHSQSNFNESTVRDESYYASVLGFQDSVMPEDVKRRYKQLASQYHPDKVGHLGQKLKEVAEQEMKNINEAYEFFKNKYGFK